MMKSASSSLELKRTSVDIVYEVVPRTADGFGTDESFSPTRWDFGA
jgi:hypothetical protein